ncbi:M24 family metallopeptidase [Pseudarthrobacter raffinosi]|uniref:M24 family metallopeptidase n=1 Tax=Pseudarthrobacter raffinosi TaxID=2953651 RepID=UPI00208F7DE0|nr:MULTISPECIES: M24 family metallopeptidase [unclassified Pseudarthrobacter]MCO4253512.1 M24 family metallopeptidase [Pseudarthrobacter sp. MDT3-9]MCO4263228.1 M24 family metallopeptidase [Pseudarthrobacter sp. MDT3-26]
MDILDAKGQDSLLLTTHTALAWYLDGSRVHISLAGDPIAALLVDRDGDHLVTFNNEAGRIAAEELPAGVALHTVPWYGNLHEGAAAVGRSSGGGAGTPLAEASVATELRAARQQLLPGESTRYAHLSAELARIMTDVLSTARPDTTEFELASALAARVVGAGAEPLVLLCNGSSRSDFRHPLATHAPLGRRAMAVVCARRDGLVANITRWVRFDAGTPEELDAESRIAAVEADIFDATVPGARLDHVFSEIKAAYVRHGFGAEQWEQHHQGGPAGYAGRDPRVTTAATDTVVLNQPFTWNPSGPGVKIEDTVQLTESGMQVLTMDDRWPATTVNGLKRPVTLQL